MSKLSERLKSFNRNLMPDMVQLKYEAMTDNAFRFYRGTCHLFYDHCSKTYANVSSSLLSTTVFRGESYVIQELQPVKDTIKFKLLRDEYRDIYQVIDDMAALTASAELRSGGHSGFVKH
jgi:hypothetical protein